jgi:hypothetical protein
MQFGRIFYGNTWLREGCFVDDDDDGDNYDVIID